VLLLNLLFNTFGINRYVANLLAIAIVTVWNFWVNLKLSWRVTDTEQ
jgi:dolichol-phosphate mannosyltransferase